MYENVFVAQNSLAQKLDNKKNIATWVYFSFLKVNCFSLCFFKAGEGLVAQTMLDLN